MSTTLMVSIERTQKPTVTSTGPPVNQSIHRTINQTFVKKFSCMAVSRAISLRNMIWGSYIGFQGSLSKNFRGFSFHQQFQQRRFVTLR